MSVPAGEFLRPGGGRGIEVPTVAAHPFATAGLIAGLVVAGLAVAAVIHRQSSTLALTVVAGYGIAFALLAWYRLRLALLGLVVALPLITVEVGLGHIDRTVSTDKVALAAVVAVWLLRRGLAKGPRLMRLASARWWSALLGLIALSSLYHGATLAEVWNLAGYLVYAGIFLVALDVFDGREAEAARVLRAGAMAAVVVAGLGLVEWALSASDHWTPFYFKQGTMFDPVVRQGAATTGLHGSTIGHVNFLGGYLNVFIPILLVSSVIGPPAFRMPAALGALVGGFAMAWTGSVGAWVALTVAILVATLLLARGQRPTWMKSMLIVVVMVLFAATIATSLHRAPLKAVSVSLRLAMHQVGLAAIVERPVLGFGAHGFERESRRLERAILGNEIHTSHSVRQEGLSAHSAYLNLAVSRGVPALLAFCGLLASLLAAGVRGYFSASDPARRALLLALITGLVAFIVQAFTENLFTYSKIGGVFWIMAALMVRITGGRADAAHAGNA